jgi:RNA polymerase sigma factor (sigma-70 family)
VTAPDIPAAIDAVWRIESPKIVGTLMRITRDLNIAEDLAQDALLAALQQWPESGIPDNPGAWLTAAAKNRAIDHFRRNQRLDRKHQEMGYDLQFAQARSALDLEAALDNPIEDDLLRLIFIACHPVLPVDARLALTLRLLGGLQTTEIARALLASEPAIAQRIVRAKRTLAEQQIPFEIPRGAELTSRISSVLAVIYLIFNEGYSATAGADWLRPALCEEALRLGRVLAELMPSEPEVHGLVALMEIQSSRSRARVSPAGEPILLADQNRAQWDQLLIRRGLAALARAQKLSGPTGPYLLQAAIAACHARAHSLDQTDWPKIVQLYSELASLSPSPIIELNRAVAVSMASGPQAALEIVDSLVGEPSLASFHLLPSVRGDLLFKLGRFAEAQPEFERAASLTQNEPERKLLLDRAKACVTSARNDADRN